MQGRPIRSHSLANWTRLDRLLTARKPGAPAALLRASNLRYRYRMERLDRRCLRCDKAFLAQRTTARYCSNACRQMAYLNRHRPPGGGGPLTMADVEQWLWRPTPPNPD
jgi:hypothetical protein